VGDGGTGELERKKKKKKKKKREKFVFSSVLRSFLDCGSVWRGSARLFLRLVRVRVWWACARAQGGRWKRKKIMMTEQKKKNRFFKN
jgi:hypothetical protein